MADRLSEESLRTLDANLDKINNQIKQVHSDILNTKRMYVTREQLIQIVIFMTLIFAVSILLTSAITVLIIKCIT